MDQATACSDRQVGKVGFDLAPVQVAVVEEIDRPVYEGFAVFSGHYDRSVYLAAFDHSGSQSHGVDETEAGI